MRLTSGRVLDEREISCQYQRNNYLSTTWLFYRLNFFLCNSSPIRRMHKILLSHHSWQRRCSSYFLEKCKIYLDAIRVCVSKIHADSNRESSLLNEVILSTRL